MHFKELEENTPLINIMMELLKMIIILKIKL
jgi:hypothetical protein